jgi:hypothetical protein
MKEKYIIIGVILSNQTWLLLIVNLGLLPNIWHMTTEILKGPCHLLRGQNFKVQSRSDKEKRERFFAGEKEKRWSILFHTDNIKFYV